MAVDDDRERHAVEPGDDAAVELRRAAVDGDRVALCRVTDGGHALGQQALQHAAFGIGRAADQEVLGGGAPTLLQPLDIGLKSAGRCDHYLGADLEREALAGHGQLVHDVDAEPLGMGIERVQQRLAATEEEGVGAGQVERAGQRRLEHDAAALQEWQRLLRHADGQPG